MGTVSNNDEIQETTHNWTGNLITVNGKKCLLFVDKKTLYYFLMPYFSKKYLPRLKELFLFEFVEQLKRDDLYSREIAQYFVENFKEIKFFRTDNDQKTLGAVRDFEYTIQHYYPSMPDRDIALDMLRNEHMNKYPLGGRKFAFSKNLMLEYLTNQGFRV